MIASLEQNLQKIYSLVTNMAQDRYLGQWETKHAPPSIVNVVVPTQLSLKRVVDVKLLEKAVLNVISVQPNLQSGITKVDRRWKFHPLKEIRDIFEALPSTHYWKDVCLKYSKAFLREDAENFPPLKVYFIPTSNELAYLVLVYAHFAGDGTNGMSIVNDILQIYSSLRRGEEVVSIPFSASPSVDDMALSGLGSEKETLQEKFIADHLNQCKQVNCTMSFDESKIPASEALYYTSTTAVYNQFLSTCRENQVTVGAALMAANWFGYAAYIFENAENPAKELFISNNIPINLRRRTPKSIPWNCVNLCFTLNMITMGISKATVFWELACKIKNEIDTRMNSDNKFHLFDGSFMDDISGNKLVQNMVEKDGVRHQFAVSNMRCYPASVKYDDFTVESIHCVGGVWLIEWDVLELMVYSANKFNISMIYRQGEANAQRADAVFKYIKYIIELPSSLKSDFTLMDCMKNYHIMHSAL